MVTLITLRKFHDTTIRGTRAEGDVFEATEERAARIMAALPGYVAVHELPEDTPDYASMTVAQLRALCAERGVDVPKGSKKADIIELLEV